MSLFPLLKAQMRAVEPRDTVWLSASAGTGKTQVLTARVLRLLLEADVHPSEILCLTFTKAGATEMSTRIKAQLASWVRADPVSLAKDLMAIGADSGPETSKRARTLFAAVLDCPGGGLRIDTIHAFSQWLLAAFPQEAGLSAGTRTLEDRDRVLLARQVLADLLVKAESGEHKNPDLLEAASMLSLRMGADKVEGYLLRCAGAYEAWFGPGSWQGPLRPHIHRLLGIPADADNSWVHEACSDAVFDVQSLRDALAAIMLWQAPSARKMTDAITEWLAREPAARAEGLINLRKALFSKELDQDGHYKPKYLKNILKHAPDYEEIIARVSQSLATVINQQALLALAEWLCPALLLGRAFAIAWDEAKRREGLIDFDDQVRLAAQLLRTSGQAQWIAYKLDRRFNHLLVDEAQDTNAVQWDIIDTLTEEFFAGIGQHDDEARTLFVVGDYKQAIFGFQGTSPENFQAARQRVQDKLDSVSHNAITAPDGRHDAIRPLATPELNQSFRSAKSILAFVDEALTEIGHTRLGLASPPPPHEGEERPGAVILWEPVGQETASAGNARSNSGDEDEEEQNWLRHTDREMAERIARQVKAWLTDGYPLYKGRTSAEGPRNAGPGDIMVLVRERADLAALIVARLYAAGVPVAGVDRLRLAAPLCVQDLLAALRFAAQPLDDLNLAALLVSPLIGWSQEDLLAYGWRDKGVKLWYHLRAARDAKPVKTCEQLRTLLARADMKSPHALLYWLLSGPWDGRRRLVARLGREVNDPINELVNAAFAYTASHTASLAGFLQWFDAGEGELKREADNADQLVRVMTVHGAKGLQAPIVILADAAKNPDKRQDRGMNVPDPANPARTIPFPPTKKEDQVGRLSEVAEHISQNDDEEHWRLLYVAMTRAEEALFIGGALGRYDKDGPSPNSWYGKLAGVFRAEDGTKDDPIWGSRVEYPGQPPALEKPVKPAKAAPDLPAGDPEQTEHALPDWLLTPAGEEPRPPRPLAPSSLGEDMTATPPLAPGTGTEAARRGVLIHKLLERMPDVPPDERLTRGDKWLIRNAPELGEEGRAELLSTTLAVIEDARWAELFGPDALAEVSITAPAGGQVIAGTIDRLLMTNDFIRLVDFKTARRPPVTIQQVPAGILRQMAAYALALETIYTGRRIEAALLYTSAPRLIVIPDEILDIHKQTLPKGI